MAFLATRIYTMLWDIITSLDTLAHTADPERARPSSTCAEIEHML